MLTVAHTKALLWPAVEGVAALAEGRTVYVPLDGLGTGLAQLPTRSPAIHKHIVERFRAMSPKCPWSTP